MEGDTHSEVKHIGVSVVYLMWCSIVITEITYTMRKNVHCGFCCFFCFVFN